MNKFLRISGIAALLIVVLKLTSFFTYEPDTDDQSFRKAFNEKYGIYALTLPEDLTFAGEYVPFEDPDIYERFDKELLINTYWQSQTMLFHKRANRYFKIIEPILKKYNVPNDFKYLSLVESGFTNAVSPAGATGFWQIMEATGKSYGLEITKEVDERYNLAKSTEVAARYLREAYDKFGSWTLAAASYNMGVTGLLNQLERQEAESYYDLTLNSETSRYIFRILAVKEIMENPLKYGFHFRKRDLYQHIPTYTVKIDTAVSSFGNFAENLGINYRILKYHNPWLRYEYLPNPNGKVYEVEIPKKGFYWIDDEEAQIPAELKPEPDSIPPISDTASTIEPE